MSALSDAHTATSRALRIALIALIALFALVNLAALNRYPMPNCDEINHSAISYGFFHGGRFAYDYMADYGNFSTTIAAQGRIYQVAKGLLIHPLGYTLFAGRLFSLLGWLANVVVIYAVGKRLFGEMAGLSGAAIFAASMRAFYASHIGREDIWVSAVGLALFWLYLAIRERPSLARFALLGLLMGLAIDVHPNTIWYSLPLAIFVATEQFKTGRGRVNLAAAGFAGIVALALIAYIHLLPDRGIALQQLRTVSNNNDLWVGRLTGRLVAQLDFMFDRYISDLSFSASAATAYIAAGIGFTLWRGRREARLLLAAFALSLLGFTFLMSHKNPHYGIIYEAWLALIAGAALVDGARLVSDRFPALRAEYAPALLLLPLIAAGLAAQVYLSAKFFPRDFAAYQAKLLDVVPPDVGVMGDISLWHAFNERNPFIADRYMDFCHGAGRCTGFTEAEISGILDAFDIQYVIEDGRLGCSLEPTLRSEKFAAYLDAQCTPIAQIDDPWFGAGGQVGAGQPTRVFLCGADGG